MSFTLKGSPIIIVVVIIPIVVVPPPILIISLLIPCSVTLVSRFYSAIGHYVCSLVEILRTSCGVFSYAFELLIRLECIINGHDVKDEKNCNDSAHKTGRLLDKRTSSMGILFYLLFLLGFSFSFVISVLLSITHVFPCLTILCSVLIFFFAFTLSPIMFILFVIFRFWMILIVFVSIWINVGAISLFTR